MRKILTIASLILVLQSHAQLEFGTDFGIFTQKEIDYKVCPFDKEADAVVFFDKGLSNYDDEYNLITDRHIRMKILKEKGISRGDIKILYYSNDQFEFIKDIDAVVLSVDENNNQTITKLNKKNIFDRKLNAYYSEITIALPNIKVGSIIDYRYMSHKKSYGGLRDWIFQNDIPVLLSKYDLYIIPNHEFAYTVKKDPSLSIDIRPNSTNGEVVFSMKDIPGLRDEAYMASEKDYLQQVNFQLSGFTNYNGSKKVNTTWKELARTLLDESEFGSQLNKDVPNTAELKALCEKEPSPFQKMRTIYNYVRNNMNWDKITGLYSADGIKKAWEKKKGDAGDINLLLMNLLKSNGFETYPLLISERHFGKVDTTYPYLSQFNKAVALVVLNDNSYILDGVDRYTPAGTIPYEFLNTKAFLVDKKKSRFITITDDRRQKRNVINLTASVSAEGPVTGEATIYNYDYARIEKIKNYGADINKYKEGLTTPDVTLDSFSVSGLETDTIPLTEKFKLKTALNKSGNYYLLNYNLFSGYSKNPFVSENRFSTIDFGCTHSSSFNETFAIPSDLAIESLPKNTILKTPDNSMSISRIIEKQENNIHVVVRVEVKRTEFSTDEYSMVKDFYKKMIEYLDEPIVFKSK